MEKEPISEAAREMRDFARVLKAALGIALSYWKQTLPTQHPYQQAVIMVVRYLERRYGV